MLSEVTCSLQGPQGQVENILETFVDSFKLGVTNTAGLIVAFWVFVFGGGVVYSCLLQKFTWRADTV